MDISNNWWAVVYPYVIFAVCAIATTPVCNCDQAIRSSTRSTQMLVFFFCLLLHLELAICNEVNIRLRNTVTIDRLYLRQRAFVIEVPLN